MNNNHILEKTLKAFENIGDIKENNRYKPCFAMIYLPNGVAKKFNTYTSRQRKFIYSSPGALKNSLRAFLEYNVYDIVKSKYGYDERDYLTSAQVDMIMNYLFDNNIVQIVYL